MSNRGNSVSNVISSINGTEKETTENFSVAKESDKDTIYNLLFRKYDMMNVGENNNE